MTCPAGSTRVYPEGSDTHDQTIAIIEDGGSRTISNGGTCFNDGRPNSERRVQIAMSRTSAVEGGFVSTDIDINARSVTRYERA